ncbi:Epimerase family protein [Stieleria maiorica]|uniref:Epimerase family protein n=1 Tax=Stieleria maiorica TaxID=2795974 RepID=A0A5B9MH39_9BACT|nr:TIGR01777 family oxidoreductase [Stieleria maiorica]QEF98397.1 Epimerase family protein [Stieleria maiorica]
MKKYVASTTLPVGVEEAFAYHERRGALDRLIPPWKNVTVESSDGSLKRDSVVVLKLKSGPAAIRWVAQHTEYDPPKCFVDVQRRGPFAHWEHRHQFDAAASAGSVLRDSISYKLPLGGFLGASIVRKELETMFAYRHRVTRDDLELAAKYQAAPMQIAVSGASGLVGKKLCSLLTLLGHRVIRLERSLDRAEEDQDALAPWESSSEAEKLSGIDAVVHLAGKPIAQGRWTDSIKQQIRDSRVDLTNRLAAALAKLPTPPKVMVCASAVGIYGDRGNEVLTESSAPGDTFLAKVASEWEQACRPAEQAGIRVANARLGMVLDPRGGALEKMLLPAKFFGGALGDGSQWWSWISADDVIGAIYHAICDQRVSGPFNLTAPEPLTNRDFARTLGQVISRPALIPAPAFGLRLALGEMADALLLASTRVIPSVLQDTGYEFRFTCVDEALRYHLGVNRLESIE